MHVLIIPSTYPTRGNPVRGCFYREQALALQRYGLRIGIVAPQFRSLRHLYGGDVHKPENFRVENDEGVQVVRLEKLARFSLLPRLHARHWLAVGTDLFRRYIGRFGRPDIVHAHGALPAGRLAEGIAQRAGIPYVVTEHNTAYSRQTIRPWQDAIIRQVLRQASSLIAVSPDLARLLEERYRDTAGRWQWIPNIVSPIFQPAEAARPTSVGMRFRFLNVGLLTAKKGHDVLLRSAANLQAAGIDFELRIAGDGPLKHRLVRQAKQLGIATQLTFLGRLDRHQVAEEMQAAHCFVLPSRHETFGVVLIEALACGLPVIATTCGGPECIVEKEDGILVPPDDANAFTSAMKQIRFAADNYRPETLHRRCLERFGAQAIAPRIAEIYARVLHLRHTGSGAWVA